MQVILYSTNCPRCRVLESKLASARIEYTIVEDVDVMLAKGLKNAPNLEVDGTMMDFKEAVEWIKR